jgi:hypothetical protein
MQFLLVLRGLEDCVKTPGMSFKTSKSGVLLKWCSYAGFGIIDKHIDPDKFLLAPTAFANRTY